MQGVDEAELLDRRQRGTMAELDRARADPDGGRGGRGQREHDRRGGAGHAGVEMVLGQPVPGVAESLGLPGQVDAVAQRLAGRAARRDRDQVEHGERGGGHDGRYLHDAARAAEEPVRSGARPRCSRSVLPS